MVQQGSVFLYHYMDLVHENLSANMQLHKINIAYWKHARKETETNMKL